MPRAPTGAQAKPSKVPRPRGAARASTPKAAAKRAAPAPPSTPARRGAAPAASPSQRGTAGARGAASPAASNRSSSRKQQVAASLGRIERKTVAMLALEQVRERILRGDYREGAPLRQDALAAELGVSRIPVREALRQLEAEGLVTFSPHVGAVVSTLSLNEIRELFELRALLESEVLRRAVAHMHQEDLERAAAVLGEYRTAFRRGDVAAWGKLNWEFHAALLRPAGQPLTMGILQTLHNQSDRYTRLQLTLTHGEDRAREEHSAILEAVQECETQHACALLTSHILGAGRSLLEFLRADRGLSSAAADGEHA